MRKSFLLRCLALCMILCTVLGCFAIVGTGAENQPAADLDNDPGSLTYTVSEDGSTVTITYLLNGEKVSYTVPNNHNYTSGGLVGTDDLGRKLYTTADENIVSINSKEGERYVGLFYFLWHGEHGDSGIFDMQKILEEQGAEVAGSISQSGKYGPEGEMHWFAEPLYGYYYANDEWVHRKHAELLTQANVDFLYFDVTNGYYYLNNALSVMKACHELNEQGFDAPQVVFYTHSGAENVVRGLYNDIYSKGLYEDTWFRIDGKPVVIAPYEANINDFFTIKREQWPNDITTNQNGWPWMDFNWPARVFPGLDADKKKDGRNAISVSVAQHAGNTIFSTSALYGFIGNRGRSFNATKQNDKTLQEAWEAAQNDPTLSYQGLNFQAQWDRAIKKDVTYVLVTGWNEWEAGRTREMWGDPNAIPDNALDGFSRDIEPSTGVLKDHFYYQMVSYIRRFKGIPTPDAPSTGIASGSAIDWDSVSPVFRSYAGNTLERNADGYRGYHYENRTGRNDIVESRVTYDRENLYFYVRTARPLSPETDKAWMRLFLDVGESEQSWETFEYIINRQSPENGKATLERFTGGWNFEAAGSLAYAVTEDRLVITVPRAALGLESDTFTLAFKWSDNAQADGDVMDFYSSGDTAPGGRFKYVFTAAPAQTASETVAADTDSTQAPVTETESETGTSSGGCRSAVPALMPLAAAAACAFLHGKRRRDDTPEV